MAHIVGLYHQIIENVIEKMQNEFINSGIDEAVLSDLRDLWMKKLNSALPLAGLNDGIGHELGGPSALAASNGAADKEIADEDDQLFASSSFPYQNYQLPPQLNAAVPIQPALARQPSSTANNDSRISAHNKNANRSRANNQLDGAEDDEDEKTPVSADEEDKKDDEDELNSDLDDDEDEDDDEIDAGETGNRILCQFEKVNRSRNKWKCVLKDGIASVNGRDYAFHKAQCDFEF